MRALSFTLATSLAITTLLAADTQAQCPSWRTGFNVPGLNGTAYAAVAFDDGSGPALYVGGYFTAAGDVPASKIARWTGSEWQAVGIGIAGDPSAVRVWALAVYDSGNGPELYAGGQISTGYGSQGNQIVKWTGTSWVDVGYGPGWGSVETLAVYDDGSGAKLYAGGPLYPQFGAPSSGVVAFDGSTWSGVGSGVDDTVYSLAVHDDGTGPALYAGGVFSNAGGTPASRIARWDGANWSALGSGISPGTSSSNGVFALESFDDGSGARLYAAGRFGVAGSTSALNIASWNGNTWSAVGGGVTQASGSALVTAMRSFDDGSGPQLFVSGDFEIAGGVAVSNVARWNGATWSSAGTLNEFFGAQALAPFDDGSGSGAQLFAVGHFAQAGSVGAARIARWTGSDWAALPVAGNGITGTIAASTVFDDGSGEALYVAGEFSAAGDAPAVNVAKWDGASWHAIGSGFDGEVLSLAVYDDGSGPALYAGGLFEHAGATFRRHISKWNGSSWQGVGGGVFGNVNAMTVYDDGSGPALYVGGEFNKAGTSQLVVKYIAKWNGVAWSGLSGGLEDFVHSLAVHDDGSGPSLFVGGEFSNPLRRWDGAWHFLGSSLSNGTVSALEVFDDGSGQRRLAVGGDFWCVPLQVANVLGWDGADFYALGDGVPSAVRDFASFDDANGGGPKLYAGVRAPSVYRNGPPQLYRLDGGVWIDAGLGVTSAYSSVESLATFDDGHGVGESLFVGGNFSIASGAPAGSIAVLTRDCSCPPLAYCTAGISSHACSGSISGSGVPSASQSGSFTITVAGVDAQRAGLVLYGLSGSQALQWGGGTSYLCVNSPTLRTPVQNSAGSFGACDGALVLDWNAFVAAHPLTSGGPFHAGQHVWAQGWWRDAGSPKTSVLSNALEYVLCP